MRGYGPNAGLNPSHAFKVGDRIKFAAEKRRYTVQACNERWLICTKPFRAKKTVLYTIVDFERDVRGTENLIFCCGFETREQCEECLARLSAGQTEVSFRNWIELDIEPEFTGRKAA